MTLVDIPERTLKENLRIEKKLKKEGNVMEWWRVPADKIPQQAILAKSTGGGAIKEGVLVYLIGGHNREVFPAPAHEKFNLHEYVGLVENTGWQPLVQLGRDVDML